MNEQIERIGNVYDLMAWLSSYILEEVTKNSYEFYDFNDNAYIAVYDAIERYVSDVATKGHKAAFKILRKYIADFLEISMNIEKCYAVVCYIDELVECEIPQSLYDYESFTIYNTISKKYQQNVRIIPKLKDTLLLSEGECILRDPANRERALFRETSECPCSELDEVMQNYMIWDKDKLQRFPIEIHRLNKSTPMGLHFTRRSKLTIGVVPLTCKEIEEILDIQFPNKTFVVNGMKTEAESLIKERYIDAYRRSLLKDIDFLVYPEMLTTESILEALRKQNVSGTPQFIINGSMWKDYANRSIITDGVGNEIFTYYKRSSFKYKKDGKEYKEYLKKRDLSEPYPILEIEGIGRIGICICKDLAQEDVLMLHKYLKTDVLIVPAFSGSMRLSTDASNLAEKYNCLTVLANSCSAYCEHWKEEKEKNIGFVAIPAKEKRANVGYLNIYCANECEALCEEKCTGKMFTLSFNNISSYNKKFSIDIKESVF